VTKLVLVAPHAAYRAEDFLAAARRAGADVVLASDRCHVLAGEYGWPGDSLAVDFRVPDDAAEAIARAVPDARAIVAVEGETPALIASLAAARLGLAHNDPDAAAAARDKLRMITRLADAGIPTPRFEVLEDGEPSLPYPVVLKPRTLSASRGVIRADSPEAFRAARARLAAILALPDVRATDPGTILVEEFVPGPEIAVEGIIEQGALRPLAIFDKPDPLDGPFFEETIYVTPSRHGSAIQRAAADVTARAAAALGLTTGPVHAELRLSPRGPVVIELAARAIGGLCGRVLRFGTGHALEDLIVRQALGDPAPGMRESAAAGVMMLPIPAPGVLRAVEGVDEARRFVDEVTITARLEQELVPLPEGSSYLGFLFARGDDPASVEDRLRSGQRALRFTITRMIQ
jgi:biotin carboxylase